MGGFSLINYTIPAPRTTEVLLVKIPPELLSFFHLVITRTTAGLQLVTTQALWGVFRVARLGFVIRATFRGTIKFAPPYVGGC